MQRSFSLLSYSFYVYIYLYISVKIHFLRASVLFYAPATSWYFRYQVEFATYGFSLIDCCWIVPHLFLAGIKERMMMNQMNINCNTTSVVYCPTVYRIVFTNTFVGPRVGNIKTGDILTFPPSGKNLLIQLNISIFNR